MKQTRNYKVKLGIFITVGIAFFVIAIYYIGQGEQLFNKTFRISAVFKDISGVQVGNNVRYSGLNVGIVDNLQQISDTSVRVDMLINERTKKFIKKSAMAMIGSDGLMGNKIIVIIPGTGDMQEINNGDAVATIKPVTIDDILLKIKITADNAANITDDIAAMTDNIRNGKGAVGKMFFDSAFAQNLDKTMVNLKQGAGGLKQNMDAASHSFFLRGFLKKKHKKEEEEKEDAKERDKN